MSSECIERILDLVCCGLSEDSPIVYKVPMCLLKLHANVYGPLPCCYLLEKGAFKKIRKEFLKQKKNLKLLINKKIGQQFFSMLV